MCQSQPSDKELYTVLTHNTTSELYTESNLVTKLALNVGTDEDQAIY